ncbi:MAG: hypothetical protein WCS37_21340 [Chloroflexota bacterium]|nr:hypothetical protein [Chloroflexota bacterium]
MSKLFCYNHSPEPILMLPNETDYAEANLLYTCPTCRYQVKLVINDLEGQIPSHQKVITEEEVRIFLEEYIRCYQLADLNLFMTLWSDYATQSFILELGQAAQVETSLEAIRRNYRDAFKRMGQNTYYFNILELFLEDNNMKVNAIYKVEYPANSLNPQIYQGRLSMLLSRNFNDKLEILHLSYQPYQAY